MKITHIAGLGIIGVLAYVVWQGGKDLFGAGGQIAAGLQQAPAVISQYFNPFDYGPDLIGALSEYARVSAEYNVLLAEREEAREERRIEERDVELAAEEYKRDPSVETRTKFLEEYRESYEKQLAHVSPGWQPITISGEIYETAEEWLTGTLTGKGLSKQELEFVTGSSPSLPDPLTPAPDVVHASAEADTTRTGGTETDIGAYGDPYPSGAREITKESSEEDLQVWRMRNPVYKIVHGIPL